MVLEPIFSNFNSIVFFVEIDYILVSLIDLLGLLKINLFSSNNKNA